MTKKILVAVLLGSTALAGCKTASVRTAPEPIILSLGDQQVPVGEFAYVYRKNNATTEEAFSDSSVREYLELYTNFKLKVLDAERRGLDTTEAFRSELEVYRKQLAQPYLTEKEVTEALVEEAYARMKEEVSVSHVLISVTPNADPKDTLAAYQKALDVRQKAEAGQDFGALARQYSEDPSAARNDGRLGYFSSLQMVYPFEEAAYQTPPGQLSPPVRTRFGYHILKVHDRRTSRGKVKVAHLMIRANPGMPAADSLAAKQKADELYKKLQEGADWNVLVRQFSEDNGSRNQNGELATFGTGSMIPTFEEAAFALQNPDDISEPVQTPYGWHIIRLLERVPLEPFDELEASIRSKVSKDSRSERNRQALLTRLRRENNFRERNDNVEKALTGVDSSYFEGTWQYDAQAVGNRDVLFTIADSAFTRGDFFAHLKANQRKRAADTSPTYAARLAYEKYRDEALVAYEEAQLEEKYEDYRMLVKEYRDGILLFQLMDEEVWSRAMEDTTGLQQFFADHRDRYQWGERAQATIYSTSTPAAMQEVKRKLAGKIFKVNDPQLDDLNFDRNRAELTESVRRQLENAARRMASDTLLYLDVIGHADRDEKAAIARQRVDAVAAFLEQAGVPAGRLIVKDFGQRDPAATGTNPKNKRVSFQVYSSSDKALERVMNQQTPLTLQVTAGKFEAGEQAALDRAGFRPGTYDLEMDGRIYYVVVSAVEPPRPRELDEARGLVISDYQNYLEAQWVAELRNEYPVTVNEAEVQRLIQSAPN